MGKVISATTLRTQLSTLLDELKDGQTHFIVERNNEAAAVLLSITKFQEIMQTLELLNTLEYIGPDEISEVEDGLRDFPEPLPSRAANRSVHESIEVMAARLGIRLIK